MTPDQAGKLNEMHRMISDLVIDTRLLRNEVQRQGAELAALRLRIDAIESGMVGGRQ